MNPFAAFEKFIAGYKTYLVAVVAFALAIAQAQGIAVPDYIMTLLAGLGLAGVRAAVSNTTK